MDRYNVELTLECRSCEDARKVEEFMFFSGFLPVVDKTTVSIIAKGVDGVALGFVSQSIEDDDRIISSSLHRTPL